jgi:hypothetical protein
MKTGSSSTPQGQQLRWKRHLGDARCYHGEVHNKTSVEKGYWNKWWRLLSGIFMRIGWNQNNHTCHMHDPIHGCAALPVNTVTMSSPCRPQPEPSFTLWIFTAVLHLAFALRPCKWSPFSLTPIIQHHQGLSHDIITHCCPFFAFTIASCTV